MSNHIEVSSFQWMCGHPPFLSSIDVQESLFPSSSLSIFSFVVSSPRFDLNVFTASVSALSLIGLLF